MREVVVPTFVYMSQPLPEALAQLAADGVRLIELHGDAPDTHIDVTDEAAVEALAGLIRELPLALHSVHCAFSQPSKEAWDISQPDERKRAVAVCNRVKVIRASARLRARHVVVHPGVGQRGEELLAHSRASLAELAEVAEEAGARIAVENLEPDHLGGCVEEMKRVLEGFDPAVVGFCLDTGHAMLGEDSPSDYIRAFGDRMFGIHWHGNDQSDDAHLFPDVAHSEWEEFLAALDEVGYDLPVTLEAAPPPGTPLAEALGSVRAALQQERASRLA